MATDAGLAALPDTPAGRQLRWYLERISSSGNGAADEDADRFIPAAGRRWLPQGEDVAEGWRRLGAQLAPFRIAAVVEDHEHSVTVEIKGAEGKRWRVVCEVETGKPYRIVALNWERLFDFEVTVREATEADGPVLADVERRCPIVLDDQSVTFDRGDGYFAFARLMEEVTVGLGFVDGVPAAINCGGVHEVRIGGEQMRIMTAIHTRVLPEHQKKGLWGAVSRILGEKYLSGQTAGSRGFVAANNSAMQRGFANTPHKWPVQALRCQLRCEDLAGPAAGRPATADDAARIVELINATHADEEMYLSYTVETLKARMQRAPGQYSWEQVRLTDEAVVGVWPAGESIRVIAETNGQRTVSLRGLVLDYGFEPGAEDALETLLRAWCGWLVDREFDTLSVFTSERSPGYERLRGLASAVDAFDMWTPGIPPPEGAEVSGLYVDQVYF